jgi:sugar phosphate isomerase/epimerase
MQGKPQDWMTVGIVHFMAFPQTMGGSGPIPETVRVIAEDPFFGAIELGPINDAAVRREVRDVVRSANLQVGFGCQPIELANKLDPNSLDEPTRQAAVAKIKEGIDMAADVGATRVAMLSGPDPGDARRQQAYDALARSLDELISYAESKGISSFALETFDRTIDKKSLVGPTSEAVPLARRVREKHAGFGLMLDLSHLPLQFETVEQMLPPSKDVIIHAHIGNCVLTQGHKLYGDLHPHFGCEGGVNDVPEVVGFLRGLQEIGYIGPGKKNIVAFEVRPHNVHDKDTSEGVIANAKETLTKAWAQL